MRRGFEFKYLTFNEFRCSKFLRIEVFKRIDHYRQVMELGHDITDDFPCFFCWWDKMSKERGTDGYGWPAFPQAKDRRKQGWQRVLIE